MAKLVLLSVIVVANVVPIMAASQSHGRGALRKALAMTAVFNLLYALAILYLVPRLH